MQRAGRARAAVAAAFALLCAGGLGARAEPPGHHHYPECEVGGQVTEVGPYAIVRAPRYPLGPAETTLHAIDPNDRMRVWVSNGVSVMRSADAGCIWSTAYVLPQDPGPSAPVSAETSTIKALTLPEAPGEPRRALLYVHDSRATATASTPGFAHLLVTEDDGATWQSGDGGRAALAVECIHYYWQCPLVGAPSDPDVVYLGQPQDSNNGAAHFYASADGGHTWSERTVPIPEGETDLRPAVTTFGVEQIAVDPRDPQALWAESNGVVYGSTDGGRTWRQATLDPPPVSQADREEMALLPVEHPPGSAAQVRVVDRGTTTYTLYESVDGGATFRARPLPGVAGYLASATARHTDGGLQVVVATDRGLYRLDPGSDAAVDVDYLGLSPLAGATADHAARPRFGFHTPDAVVVYDPHEHPDPTATPGSLPRRATPLAPAPPATLAPATAAITAAAGHTARRDYTLTVRPAPAPVDVFFLVDTTVSMQPAIDGLKAGLDRLTVALRDSGLDVNVGLGHYESYGNRYRRIADFGPPDDAFRRRLAGLRESSGTEETQSIALTQLATGAGYEPHGPGLGVPPGQQATFRRGAAHVVVHVTDDVDNEDPGGPTIATAGQALAGRGIRHVGVAILDAAAPGGRDVTASPVVAELAALARATGAYAPPGGVDCDGDTLTDVPAGAPLVCPVTESLAQQLTLAAPIAALVRSLAVPRPVTVAASAPPGFTATATTLGGSPALRDATVTARVRLAVTCPARAASGSVHLTAAISGVPAATADATVICAVARAPRAAGRPDPIVDAVAPDPLRPAALAVPPAPPAAAAPAAPVPGQAPATSPLTGVAGEPQERSETQLAESTVPTDEQQVAAQLAIAALLGAAGIALHRGRSAVARQPYR